jgi:hypothetical protein
MKFTTQYIHELTNLFDGIVILPSKKCMSYSATYSFNSVPSFCSNTKILIIIFIAVRTSRLKWVGRCSISVSQTLFALTRPHLVIVPAALHERRDRRFKSSSDWLNGGFDWFSSVSSKKYQIYTSK